MEKNNLLFVLDKLAHTDIKGKLRTMVRLRLKKITKLCCKMFTGHFLPHYLKQDISILIYLKLPIEIPTVWRI